MGRWLEKKRPGMKYKRVKVRKLPTGEVFEHDVYFEVNWWGEDCFVGEEIGWHYPDGREVDWLKAMEVDNASYYREEYYEEEVERYEHLDWEWGDFLMHLMNGENLINYFDKRRRAKYGKKN